MTIVQRPEVVGSLQAYQKRADEAGTHVKAPGPVAICKEIYREEGILVRPFHSAIAPLFSLYLQHLFLTFTQLALRLLFQVLHHAH